MTPTNLVGFVWIYWVRRAPDWLARATAACSTTHLSVTAGAPRSSRISPELLLGDIGKTCNLPVRIGTPKPNGTVELRTKHIYETLLSCQVLRCRQ